MLADLTHPAATLRADPEVGRLVRSLALSERFRFYLVVVEGARVARAVAAILEHEVAAAREAPVRVVRLDPYRVQADWRGAIPWRLLVDHVLVPLVEARAEVAAPEAIVVIDASAAPEADDEAWRVLFQRMNERRNVVAANVRGALVLALPARMERVFAHAAPDFWSIRSLSVVVEGVGSAF
jgi:hypothetical protein